MFGGSIQCRKDTSSRIPSEVGNPGANSECTITDPSAAATKPVHVSLSLACFTTSFCACRGVGDLVLVYKRVTALAGHTSRVAELLEVRKHLQREEG